MMFSRFIRKHAWLLCGVIVPLFAETPAEKGFITEWLVLGPYPNYQTETYATRGGEGYFKDHLKTFGGETGILPDPAQEEQVAFIADWSKLIAGLDAVNEWGTRETRHYPASWKIVKAKPDGFIISFDRLYPVDDFLVVYASCTIQSPDERTVQFRVGSDDDNKVWLNGAFIGGANSSQGVIKDNFIYKGKLKRGLNNVLVKIVDRTGGFGFCLAVTDPEGNAIPDLKIHTVSPEVQLRKTDARIRKILDYTDNGYLASCNGDLFGENSSLRFVSDLKGAVYTLKQAGKVLAVSKDGVFKTVLRPGELEVFCKAGEKELHGTLEVLSREALNRKIAEGKAKIRNLQAKRSQVEAETEKAAAELKTCRARNAELLKKIEAMYAARRAAEAEKIGTAGKSENKPLPAVSGKRLSYSLNGDGWHFAKTGEDGWKTPEVLPGKWLPAEMPFFSRGSFFRTWYNPLKLTDPKNPFGKVTVEKGWEEDFFWNDDFCSPTFRIRRTVRYDAPLNGTVLFRCRALFGEIRLFVNGNFDGEYRSSVGIVEIPLKSFRQGENLIELFYKRIPDPKKCANLQNYELRSGFLGDVSLEFMPKCGVAFAYAETSFRKNLIRTETEIANRGETDCQVEIRQYAADGNRIVKSFPVKKLSVKAGTLETLQNKAFWTDPVLWGIGDQTGVPHLYSLVTDVVKDGVIIDRDVRSFGFREVWSAGTNIFVNGKRVILQGDVGWGSLMNARKSANVLLPILRGNGINIIRNHDGAFYNDEFFDLCDRRGMWVYANMYPDLEEGLDHSKKLTPVEEWMKHPIHEDNLLNYRRWIRMVRNHPSVIILSSDNEIYTQAGDSLARQDRNLRNDAIGAFYGRYVKQLAPEYIITRDGDVGTWGWPDKWHETPPCETSNYHYPNYDMAKCVTNWQSVYGFRPVIYGEAVYCGHFRKLPTPELLEKNAQSNRKLIRIFREEEIPATIYMGITGEGFVSWDDTGNGNPWGVTKTMAEKEKLPYQPFYSSKVDWPARSGPGQRNPAAKVNLKGFGYGAINWFRSDYPSHRDSVINKVYREELIPQPDLVGDTAAECVVALKDAEAGIPVTATGSESWISLTDRNGKAYFLLPKAGKYTISCGEKSVEVDLKDMSSYCGKPGFDEVPHINLQPRIFKFQKKSQSKRQKRF